MIIMAKKQKTKLQKARSTFLKLFIVEIIIFYIVNPASVYDIPLIGPFLGPILSPAFGWINSVTVPNGFGGNFFQEAIGGLVNWITDRPFIELLFQLALIVIPIGVVITLIIIPPIVKIIKKIEARKIRRELSSYPKYVPSFGSSDILSIFEKIGYKRALKKLQDDTVFTLIPKNKGCIRVQTLIPYDSSTPDMILDWNPQHNIVTYPAGSHPSEAEFCCYGDGSISLFGGERVPLTPNVPFGIEDEDNKGLFKYIITWIA